MKRVICWLLLIGACYGQAGTEDLVAQYSPANIGDQSPYFVTLHAMPTDSIGFLVDGFQFNASATDHIHAVVIQIDSRTKLTIDGRIEETCRVVEITHEMTCVKQQVFSSTELFSKSATWILERDGESTIIAGDRVFSLLMGAK